MKRGPRTLIVAPKDASWAMQNRRSLPIDHILVDPWFEGEPAVDEHGPKPELPTGKVEVLS